MLLSVILVKITKAEKTVFKTAEGREITYYLFKRNTKFTKFFSGKGTVKILLHDRNNDETTIKHENGHCGQSPMFGWLFLVIAGISSALFSNMWCRWFHRNWCRYDRHYWYYKKRWIERWADRLGGVDRDAKLRMIPRRADARFPPVPGQVTA